MHLNQARALKRSPLLLGILMALSAPVLAQEATPAQAEAKPAEATTTAPAATQDDKATNLDTIVVTGSRIPRAGFDTLEPATVVTGEAIKERGMINVADALNQSVGFNFTQTPEGGQSNFAVGVNFPNRFGLGSNRTLTLVNGRRMVTSRAGTNFGSSAGMQVDLNAIPSQLVDRIENLSIGGAPTYGSDAIAGTVNIILKDKYEGAEATVNYGQTEQGNSETQGYSFIFGQNFADDRGNWVLSGNYAQIEGFTRAESDFYRQRIDYSTNSGTNCGPNDGRLDPGIPCNAGVADGVPQLVLYRNLRTLTNTFGGLILPDAATGIGTGPAVSNATIGLVPFASGARLQFNAAGQLVPYNQGIFHTATTASGGDGFNSAEIDPMLQTQDRYSVNLLGHFDMTDNVRLFWHGLHYTSTNGGPAGASATFSNTNTGTDKNAALRIRADHPLLTQQARDTLAAQGITGSRTFRLNRTFRDLGTTAEEGKSTINQWVVGANGYFDIANRSFDWEVTANWGRMHGIRSNLALNHQNFFNAINNCQTAIAYVRLTDPNNTTNNPFDSLTADPNCVPLDIFGEGRASQAAKDYVTEISRTDFVQEEQVYSAYGHTDLVDLWAGPLKVAVGIEHRREQQLFAPDAFNMAGAGRTVRSVGLQGSFHTNEYYGEMILPLASPDNGIPGLRRLDIHGKVRHVQNSEVDSFNAYTYGLQWEPLEGLLFRGNVTKSLRAPSIVEMFLQPVELFQTATDPCDKDAVNAGPNGSAARQTNCAAVYAAYGLTPATYDQLTTSVRGLRQGNPDLENEVADSWTAGVVWTPEFVKGLTVAVDYNEIKLQGQILALGAADVLTACYDDPNFDVADPDNGNQYCSLINRQPGPYNAATNPNAGQFNPFRLAYVNGEFMNFNAWTGEVAYRLDAGNVGKFGFAFNAQVRTRHESQTTPVSVVDDLIGELSFPKRTYRFDTAWDKGAFGAHLGARYSSKVVLDLDEDIEDRYPLDIPSYWMFNAGASYKIGENGKVRLNVENLFDREPKGAAMAGGNAFGDYDTLGRRYMLSINWQFN